MQLVLDIDDRPQKIAEINQRLLRHFGAPDPIYLLDPVSQLVMSLIGGITRSEVSRLAFGQLVSRFGYWDTVRDDRVEHVRHAIRAVTNADIKARRLISTLKIITSADGTPSIERLHYMTVSEALLWLERLPGVGRKVAAATLNFSTLRKPALVIDSHHLRILKRLRLVSRHACSRHAYDQIVPLLPENWDSDRMDLHHRLMKHLGRTICRVPVPHCKLCPLKTLCPQTSLA